MCKGPAVGRSGLSVQKGEDGAVSEAEGCGGRMDGKRGPSPQALLTHQGRLSLKQ